MTNIVGVQTNRTWTTAQLLSEGNGAGLGDLYVDQNGQTWQFVVSTAAITQRDTVHISGAYGATAITNALAGAAGSAGWIGFAHGTAFTTSGEHGWVMRNGKPALRLAANCADDVPLYTTDTAGVLDDATASLSQTQIMGVLADNSASAGGITVVSGIASWPLAKRGPNAA